MTEEKKNKNEELEQAIRRVTIQTMKGLIIGLIIINYVQRRRVVTHVIERHYYLHR